MAKVKNPLLSLSASGTIGNIVTYAKRKFNQVVSIKLTRKDSNSSLQQVLRQVFIEGTAAWNLLTDPQKLQYEEDAKSLVMTGYNLFIQEYINENYGVLPVARYGVTRYGKCTYA